MSLKGNLVLHTSRRPAETRLLVEEFLLVTADLPREEVARIAGVGIPTLRRWKRSGIKQIKGPVRRRLDRYLATRTPDARH